MKVLTVTLLADGSSDSTLVPVMQYLLDEWCPIPHRVVFANDLHDGALVHRIPKALDLYPCELLFVHRDSEGRDLKTRHQEIDEALRGMKRRPRHICVVPVRMTESWLLLDERAIRIAAGNPSGSINLKLPAAKMVEKVADPKECLFAALTAASDLAGRRRRQFKPEVARHRVAELMNISSLRALSSFQTVEAQVKEFFEAYEQ